MSQYFAGIDGGQSSTTVLIGDESGRVVGYGRGGPCNHVKGPEGRPKFFNAITESFRIATQKIGMVQFQQICGGFSGGPADKQSLLEEMFPGVPVMTTNDGLIALTGATNGEPGIITIAGTGQISVGRNAEGKTARAGGWGYIFGDEGGGFDLTRQALRSALRHEEGWGPPTAITGLLLEETGATSMNDLLHRFYTTDWPRPRIASLSKIVDHAALSGDPVAQDLIHAAAQQLAGYTAAARGMLFQPYEPAHVAWIGGVFRSELLLMRFRMLVELEEGNLTAAPQYGPAAGALIEAYRAAGISPRLQNVPDQEK